MENVNPEIDKEINSVKKIFEKYVDFSDYNNEDVIKTIHINKEIDWNMISEIKDLSNFIMEEFQYKLNWEILFFHRHMTKQRIIHFEKYLVSVTNSDDFIAKLNDSNTHVLPIILTVNKDLIPKAFEQGYKNNYFKIIKRLIDNPLITHEIIDKAFKWVYKVNYTKIIKELKTSGFTDKMINKEFQTAYIKNYHELIKDLDDQNITDDEIDKAFKCAYQLKYDKYSRNEPRFKSVSLADYMAKSNYKREYYEVVKNLSYYKNYPSIILKQKDQVNFTPWNI